MFYAYKILARDYRHINAPRTAFRSKKKNKKSKNRGLENPYYWNNFFMILQTREDLHDFVKVVKIFMTFCKVVKIFTSLQNHEEIISVADGKTTCHSDHTAKQNVDG